MMMSAEMEKWTTERNTILIVSNVFDFCVVIAHFIDDFRRM